MAYLTKARLQTLAVSGGVALIGGAVLEGSGYRINTTPSIPVGLYRTSLEPVSTGSIVQVCPPNNKIFEEARNRGYIGPGICPGGYEYLFKQVLAAKPDIVSIGSNGVTLNGHTVPFSVPLLRDQENRRLVPWDMSPRALFNDEILLMGTSNPKSFDARYFGPIKTVQVISVVKPVFTWGRRS